MFSTKEVRILLVSFSLIVLFALPGYSTTYYIKNAGNDSASGLTDGEAWKTISKVKSFAFSDGDTVCFKRGDRFNDATLTNPGVSNFTVKDYGSGAKPHFDGDRVQPIYMAPSTTINNLTIQNIDISGQDWYKSKSSNISIRNVNGVTIDGVIGDGHYDGNTSDGKTAITISYCTGTITVRNCVLYNWGPSIIPSGGIDFMGIAMLYVTSGSYEIHNNTIHNINADCVHLYENSVTGLVHDNVIYNAGEDGIDVKGTSNCEIYNNEFYRTSDFMGGGGSGGYQTHVIVHEGSSPQSKNVIIRNNKFHDGDAAAIVVARTENVSINYNYFKNTRGAIVIGSSSMGTWIHHNIIVDPQTTCIYENNSYTGTRIFNNTIYNITGDCKHLISIACCNASEIVDNIVYTATTENDAFCLYYISCGTEPIIKNNCWYNKDNINRIKYNGDLYPETKLADWAKSHPGALFSDPLFIDARNGDFSLMPSSPCRKEDKIIGAIQTPPPPSLSAPKNLKIE